MAVGAPGRAGRAAAVAVALALALAVLAGCQATRMDNAIVFATGPGAEVRLAGANGATVTGSALLKPYDGGLVLAANFNGVGPGEYRVVIHETGNCSSLNAFSAGPPFVPPGSPGPAPVATMLKNDDSGSVTQRLPGYRLDGPDGVMGRSVVVHAGAQGSLEAVPGVPNNRIACGVIGAPRSPF